MRGPGADVVVYVGEFAAEGVVEGVEVEGALETGGERRDDGGEEVGEGFFLGAVAYGEDLGVVADVHFAEEVLEEGVAGGEDDVAEAVLFGEDEEGVEEDFEAKGVRHEGGELVCFVH